MYKTPRDQFLRLHFERSRFSRRLEDMLLILAGKIISMGMVNKDQFDAVFDKIIREASPVPIKDKTVRNQRTEMIRLFGLVKYVDGLAVPGNRLTLLSQSQDIPRFFKSFCKQFQFPGGFLKPDKVSEIVRAGVKFKPAKHILQMLKIGESKYGHFAVSAAEVAHLVFNDKRVSVHREKPVDTLERIIDTRNADAEIDKTSDVIRYARDFLNYMVEANLLHELKGMYALNNGEAKAIRAIIADKDFFDGYSGVIRRDGSWDKEEYKAMDERWAEWFADAVEDAALETPTTALVHEDVRYPEQWKKIKEMLERRVPGMRGGALKKIGDEGEQIAFEYERIAVAKIRKDLARLVRDVSGQVSLGYDIISVNTSEGRRKKYIEVKTTKKNYAPEIEIPFTISINEWSVAEQHGNDYFIYRVIITKEGVSIFAIRNPVLRQKEGHLIAEPIGFKVVYSAKSGAYLDLQLLYENLQK